jgi:GNAT superfamily N-acetyltransferase
MDRDDFEGWWSGAYIGDPQQAFLATDTTGHVGCCLLGLPYRENTHAAHCTLVVPPPHRRRGIGTALLTRSTDEARADGRTIMNTSTLIGSPGAAFAAAHGAVSGMGDIRRVLDLADCPPERRSVLRASAEPAATDYNLVSWRGPTPESYIDQTAQVEAAMTDAPRNPGMEPAIWDTERIRVAEQAGLDRGVDLFSIAAIRTDTGEIAALTQIAYFEASSPDWGEQLITAVTRPHRGHRLGLLVKVAMLDLLAEQAPRMRWIVTSNGEPNQHMIAINEQLGYRITGRFLTWRLDLATADSTAASAAISR